MSSTIQERPSEAGGRLRGLGNVNLEGVLRG